MDKLLLVIIPASINAIVVTALGLLVWRTSSKKKVNRVFGLLSLSVACWTASNAILWVVSDTQELGLLLNRIVNFFATFIPFLLLFWILTLLKIENKKQNKIVLIASGIITIFFSFFSFPSSPFAGLFVKGVSQKLFFPYWPNPGLVHYFYLVIAWGGMLGYAIYSLFKNYSKASGRKKAQIKYVLLGVLIGFGGGSTNYPLWYGIPIPPLGNILVSVGFITCGYTIVRHRLMDIRWILGKTSIHILSFLPVLIYSITLSYINKIFHLLPWTVLIAIISATIIPIFLYTKPYLEKVAGKYFYYTYYNLQQTMKTLDKKVNKTIELDKLTSFINRSLLDALKLDKAGILLKSTENEKIEVNSIVKFDKEKVRNVLSVEGRFLIKYMKKVKKPLVVEEIEFMKEKNKDNDSILDNLKEAADNADIALFLPLFVKKKLIGIIILGPKLSGEAYTTQDMNLLENLIPQAAIAFNNALSYDEIEKRKAELEKFHNVTVGRELKMIKLKNKIDKLKKKLRKDQEESSD